MKLKHSVSESTVKSIRKVFREEVSKRRRGEVESLSKLPEKKCGRTVLLGEDLDTKLQLYLKI